MERYQYGIIEQIIRWYDFRLKSPPCYGASQYLVVHTPEGWEKKSSAYIAVRCLIWLSLNNNTEGRWIYPDGAGFGEERVLFWAELPWWGVATEVNKEGE